MATQTNTTEEATMKETFERIARGEFVRFLTIDGDSDNESITGAPQTQLPLVKSVGENKHSRRERKKHYGLHCHLLSDDGNFVGDCLVPPIPI